MFREIADIQTADMLKLPVPEVRYHNIKTKPSEIQKEMVAGLAKRAEKVRARLVKPNIDNMGDCNYSYFSFNSSIHVSMDCARTNC